MAKKQKRMTQREKADRARMKKRLQEEGILPPDKPRLNRRAFAAEVIPEFEAMDIYEAAIYLRKAIDCTVSPTMHRVTSEDVGVLKLLKLAVETKKFMETLREEGRSEYTIG